VAKPEWGFKRMCLSCGAKFYDMQNNPIVCPSCGTVHDPEAATKLKRGRQQVTEDKAKKESEAKAADGDDEDLDDDLDADIDDDDDDGVLEDTSDLDDDDVPVVGKTGGDDDDN